MYSVSKNDVKQLAVQIESLSKRVQNELDNGGDYLAVANELVRNTNTMVFALGEVHAFEQSGKKVRVPSNKTYLRDSRGRFARKV